MLAGNDPAVDELPGIEIPDVSGKPPPGRQPQGIVEIAIVQRSIPTHVDLPAAHQAIDRLRVERVAQQLEVSFMLPGSFEVTQKAPDGHVRNRVKPRESDPEAPLKFTAIVAFQTGLLWRQ
jgi:hypothetical protein